MNYNIIYDPLIKNGVLYYCKIVIVYEDGQTDKSDINIPHKKGYADRIFHWVKKYKDKRSIKHIKVEKIKEL